MNENREIDRNEVKCFGLILGTSLSKEFWDDSVVFYEDFRANPGTGLPDGDIEIDYESGRVSLWVEGSEKSAATYSITKKSKLEFSLD